MQDENPLAFPKLADQSRINNYDFYEKLYFGDHFEAFNIKTENEFSKQYKKLRYVVANFPGLMSRVMADMLFGEKIVFDTTDKNNQPFLDALIKENKLISQLYESALANSRRGDSIFKVRIGTRSDNPSAKSTIIIEEINPSIYFPVLDVNMPRYTPKQDVLAWTFKRATQTILHKETHEAGYIFHEFYVYDPNKKMVISQLEAAEFGYVDVEETKVDRSLIFHVPNVRDGSGYFGTSDYRDLQQLFFALNNRITKTDNILDKHSDPILAVPPGVIDDEGKVRKEALQMFEVDNETGGFNKPEYIVWNANLDAAFKEIDKMVEMLFMFSEISPSTMGMDNGGQAESGRALKFKLLRTIAKRNRKKMYYDEMIKEMIETSMELAVAWNVDIEGQKVSTPEAPTIDWGDGIINDETEMTDNTVKRIDSGTISRADAISRLDGITPEEAKKKVKELDKEDAITVPNIGTTPGQDANTPVPPNTKLPVPNTKQPNAAPVGK